MNKVSIKLFRVSCFSSLSLPLLSPEASTLCLLTSGPDGAWRRVPASGGSPFEFSLSRFAAVSSPISPLICSTSWVRIWRRSVLPCRGASVSAFYFPLSGASAKTKSDWWLTTVGFWAKVQDRFSLRSRLVFYVRVWVERGGFSGIIGGSLLPVHGVIGLKGGSLVLARRV